MTERPTARELTEAMDATNTRIKESEGFKQALSTRVVPPGSTTAEREEREEQRHSALAWESDERRKLLEQRKPPVAVAKHTPIRLKGPANPPKPAS